jgi:signal peptidase I
MNELVEIIKTVVYALLIALFLRVLFFQPFTIPSASMEPNLYEGDYIIVSKFSYGYSRHLIPFSPPIFKGRILEQQPHRGDIIVFKFPSDIKKDYVKRLIGLPGDLWEERDGYVFINGRRLDEPYIRPAHRDAQTIAPLRIPRGRYFMMGDNRASSCDSRRWGTVPRSSLIGKVIATYWPPLRLRL